MKSLIGNAIATLALLAGTATAVADPAVIVRGGREPALSMRDQRAVNACADAFIAKIAPGTAELAHVALPLGSGSILSPTVANLGLEVTLEARSANHGVLATATCEANYQAKVMHLYTQVLQPAIVAGLTRKELQQTLVGRL
jgi:hypothetical protein